MRSLRGAQHQILAKKQEPMRSPRGAQDEPNRCPHKTMQPVRSPRGAQEEPNETLATSVEPKRNPRGTQESQEEPRKKPCKN
jgi:hypothetical protein